jgi:hypothetical protein
LSWDVTPFRIVGKAAIDPFTTWVALEAISISNPKGFANPKGLASTV